MRSVLILRPRPGADETAARARQLGLDPVVAPLFRVAPLPWPAPDPARFEAVMLTSAHAARLAGPEIGRFRHLPCFAVGPATAAAAREAGFESVSVGGGDAADLLERIAAAGIGSVLHLCGREHIGSAHEALTVERRIVYAADAVDTLPPEAGAALAGGAPALLHSARAASAFAALAPNRADVSVVAISRNVAEAAGQGWKAVMIAGSARDEAVLELAAKLCENALPWVNGNERRG